MLVKEMISMPLQKTKIFSSVSRHISSRRNMGKVAKALLEATGDGMSGQPLLTLSKMANSLDTEPHAVSKSLDSLRERGAIVMERNRVVIKNMELLRKIALSVL